ncbi:MAG TPA: hypothetical protein VF750_08275 [Sphingomicrobium sp.]
MSEPVTTTQAPDRSAARPETWIMGVAAFVATVAIGMLLVYPRGAPQSQQPAESQSLSSPAPTPQAGERINIPSLGLGIVRPASWVTITADQNARNLRSVRMDDPEFQALATRYANSPIVAMAKHPEPYADLNPSLKINVRPLGGFAGHPPEEILAAALPMFQHAFADMRVLEGPKRTSLVGRPAGFVRMAYTLRAGTIAVPAVSEIWVVPKGPVYFMVGSGTRADERNGSRAEVRAIIDTLKLD